MSDETKAILHVSKTWKTKTAFQLNMMFVAFEQDFIHFTEGKQFRCHFSVTMLLSYRHGMFF